MSISEFVRVKTHTHTHTHTQVGQHYLQQGWTQKLMPLSRVIASVFDRERERAMGERLNAEGTRTKLYLAQHDLFEQVFQRYQET